MKELCATFTLAMSGPIIVKGSGQPIDYSFDVDGFKAKLTLVPSTGYRQKRKGERQWTYPVRELRLALSRAETASPVPPTPTQTGGKDYTVHQTFFARRLPEYEKAARTVIGRSILFFRHKLHQPLLRLAEGSDQQFAQPIWTDEAGRSAGRAVPALMVPDIPGLRGALGAKPLRSSHKNALVGFMITSQPVPLHVEILADAQGAALEGNLRRAVLELALSCEVFVKHAIFDPSDRAGKAYEALESEGRIRVRVLDLLHVAGPAAIGSSFKDFDPIAYADIDHLFRARNKVAHRGEAWYADDKGKAHKVDIRALGRWWASVGRLFEWGR